MGLAVEVLTVEHGVPLAQVKLLAARLGPELPPHVRGPGDTIGWGLSLLPWSRLHPIVRRRYAECTARGCDLGDERILRLFELLTDEPKLSTARLLRSEIGPVLDMLARHFGKETPLGVTVDVDESPVVRMWLVTTPILSAVEHACSGLRGDSKMVTAVFQAIFMMLESPEDDDQRYDEVSAVIKDVVAALASYVRGWQPRPRGRH